jgi:hypothetical protein
MWRKIHSNRDPRDTLFSELQKEFKPWFSKLRQVTVNALCRNPRFSFSVMVFLLLISAGLSFTVFRPPEKAVALPEPSHTNVVSDGFSKIMQASTRLNETLQLKAKVDSITAKKFLSATDSLLLDSCLNRLQNIQPLSK